MTPGLYAVIDIGTVTCRFLMLRVNADDTWEQVARGYRICNLGVGVDATGRLREDAMARVEAAVAEFVARRDELAAAEGVDGGDVPTVCLATSASRDASNAGEFRARIEALGARIAIIPGETEAGLSFAGAALDYAGKPVVVIDIGGGSTEIIAGVSGNPPAFARSFQVGCRRITERFLAGDPVEPEQVVAARAWVRDAFAPYIAEVCAAGYTSVPLLAVAGTATSVVSVQKALVPYDPALVHGVAVPRAVLQRQIATYAGQTVAERSATVGLDPKRGDVILGGLIILDEILDLFAAPSYTASETDLMHGAILAMARGTRF
ncbi:MAG: Ppx/GppA family phosphatase [Eggerthellaceae bacterium]|nr:Ppx/GppA family phosphatase [Eggerthellaceae bacterium]